MFQESQKIRRLRYEFVLTATFHEQEFQENNQLFSTNKETTSFSLKSTFGTRDRVLNFLGIERVKLSVLMSTLDLKNELHKCIKSSSQSSHNSEQLLSRSSAFTDPQDRRHSIKQFSSLEYLFPINPLLGL